MFELDSLVSIIVPVFNSEKFLKKCLESLSQQTYKNLEIIIIDDGSTDNSEEIYREMLVTEHRIRTFKQENRGASAARNNGIAAAKGEYIYTCDSDDYIEKNTIEKLVGIISENNADFVIFNGTTFSAENGRDLGTYNRRGKYDPCSGMQMATKLFINDEFKPGSPLAFFRRSFLTENKISFYEGIMSEDELFSFYAYNAAHTVAYLPEQLYHRRIREGSVMTSSIGSSKKFISCYTVFIEMIKYCQDESHLMKRNSDFLGRICKSTLLSYRLLNNDDKKRYISEYNQLKYLIKKYRGFGDFTIILRLHCWYFGVLLSGIRKTVRIQAHGTK